MQRPSFLLLRIFLWKTASFIAADKSSEMESFLHVFTDQAFMNIHVFETSKTKKFIFKENNKNPCQGHSEEGEILEEMKKRANV